MAEIRMTGEMRTDYDCETVGLPAERRAEAVFNVGQEVSVEKDVIVALMAGEGHADGAQKTAAIPGVNRLTPIPNPS